MRRNSRLCRRNVLPAAACLCLAWSASASAQNLGVTAAPGVPAQGGVPAGAAASNAGAKQVLDVALARYRGLKTYRDQLMHTFQLRASLGGQPADETQTMQPRLLWDGAVSNRLTLTNVPVELYADARTLWFVSPETREYISRPLSAGQNWLQAAGDFADMVRSHPVLEILAGSARSGTGFPGIDVAVGVNDDNVNGVPATRIDGRGSMPDVGGSAGQQTYVRAWFGKQDGLLLKMEIDLAPMYQQLYARAPANMRLQVQSALVTMLFTDIRTDEALDASAFTFKPPEGFRNVTRFSAPDDEPGMIDPSSLVGKPAPAIASTLLGGGEFALSSLRGKVVVLQFWSTSCQPCQSSLAVFDAVSREYKDRAVAFFGVNQDPGAATEKIRASAAKWALSVRHIMDPGATTGVAYGAARVPLTVVIDAEGVVRSARVGGGTNAEQEAAALRSAIDSVLNK